MSVFEQAAYEFCARYYPDLASTWTEYHDYYLREFQKHLDRNQGNTR